MKMKEKFTTHHGWTKKKNIDIYKSVHQSGIKKIIIIMDTLRVIKQTYTI